MSEIDISCCAINLLHGTICYFGSCYVNIILSFVVASTSLVAIANSCAALCRTHVQHRIEQTEERSYACKYCPNNKEYRNRTNTLNVCYDANWIAIKNWTVNGTWGPWRHFCTTSP